MFTNDTGHLQNPVPCFTKGNAMFTNIELRWFRDQANGQKAADCVLADQIINKCGWPVGIIKCTTQDEANIWWEVLFAMFKVNAMSYATYKS